jgi:rhodanese-related sulfurtransferase
MREVDLATFAAAVADGAMVIDVREPYEYIAGHVSGARLIPLGQVANRVAELPKADPVYVICASGARSVSAADYLSRAGIDARSVVGGTGGWQRSGRPVVAGARERVS